MTPPGSFAVRRILFLDVDGVLNRTGYRPAESLGLRSWIEPELAARLADVLEATGAEVVLSSDWRRGRELDHLRDELNAAGIRCASLAATPVLGGARWLEIEAWMSEHGFDLDSVVIVDDGYDMGPLARRFVRTSPLNGFDDDAKQAILRLWGIV